MLPVRENASPEKNITLGRNLLIEYETFARICGAQSDEECGELR